MYTHTNTHTHTQYGCCTIMNYDTGIVCALTSFFSVCFDAIPAGCSIPAGTCACARNAAPLSSTAQCNEYLASLSLSLSLSCVCVCVCLYTRTRKYAHATHTRTHLVSQCPVHTQALRPQNRYLFVISCVEFTIHTSMHGHAMQSFISEH